MSKLVPSSRNAPSSASSKTAYTAFNSVDELVAKPVVGSDGAAKWQSFQQQTKIVSTASVAPTAPLKATDRAVGFTSWHEERAHANAIRTKDQVPAVYTHFGTQKGSADGLTKKERKRIESGRIGEDQEYFIPSSSGSKTFEGWKFDYVFTTKDSHGTGYYFDGMDSLKKLRGEALPVVSVESATKTAAKSQSADTFKRTRSKDLTPSGESDDRVSKKKRKRNAVVTIVDLPNHPLEQVAAVLSARHADQQQQAQLPAGWEVAVSSLDQKEYYFNRTTGERTWTKPSFAVAPTTTAATTTTTPWHQARDPVSGKDYYYNSTTGETVWERPDDCEVSSANGSGPQREFETP
jgi:WW domain